MTIWRGPIGAERFGAGRFSAAVFELITLTLTLTDAKTAAPRRILSRTISQPHYGRDLPMPTN